MSNFNLLLPVVLLTLCFSTLQAFIIRVPADSTTIQLGINGTMDGDTVLVANGTYTGYGNRDIDFLGKAIVVMSENGPENCVIDCEGGGRGFIFQSGEDSTSVLKGLTITNGYLYEDYGAGIYCSYSSPTIKDNIITGNSIGHYWYAGYGGGISCVGSSAIITGNTITGNENTGLGGGIYCSGGSATITGNTISGNSAGGIGDGGGICTDGGFTTITGNTITGNFSERGCGIQCIGGSTTITGNIITGNGEGLAGGGILCSGSTTITGNTISGNSVWQYGGGICGGGDSTIITGNTISGNLAWRGGGMSCGDVICSKNTIFNNNATDHGGGIRCGEGVFFSNTLIENTANNYGGGIYCTDSSPTFSNTILWNNDAQIGEEIYADASSFFTIHYSVVDGWLDGVYFEEGCYFYWGPGILDEDPMFVLPDKNDFRLLWHSPCIDKGHPDSQDPDGTRSDIGAHAFDQNTWQTLYVTPDTTAVERGGQLGVTYTAINRRTMVPRQLWIQTQTIMPNGNSLNVFGPVQYTLEPDTTVQVHIMHDIPMIAPTGVYEYLSAIGIPPSNLIDWDSFTFKVTE
jgi:predicted outer membrane repeat protein